MDKIYIRDRIIKTYMERINELSLKKQRHFLYRLWLVTESDSYKKRLKKEVEILENEFEKRLDDYFDDFEKIRIEKINKIRNKKIININGSLKYKTLSENVEYVFWEEILNTLRYIRLFKKEFDLRERDKKELKSILEKLINNENYIKLCTVSACNLIYFAKNLMGIDLENRFLTKFEAIFAKKIKEKINFFNYIYGLTHIIIGDSVFYIREVDKVKYNFVKELLVENLDRIWEELTLDINIETALCLKMIGYKNDEYFEKVYKRIERNFDKEKGYVEREADYKDFETSEHSNSLVLLLFSERLKIN